MISANQDSLHGIPYAELFISTEHKQKMHITSNYLLQIHTDSQQAPTFREAAALSDCYVQRKLCARSRECHIVAQQRLTWHVGGQGQRGVGEGGDGHHGGVSMAEHAAGS